MPEQVCTTRCRGSRSLQPRSYSREPGGGPGGALELLYSARNAGEARRDDLGTLPWLRLTEAVAARALDIQRQLAGTGRHRRPIPDLLVAATALEHDATVLHYDRDFELIAEATGLSARWIMPAGTGHGGST